MPDGRRIDDEDGWIVNRKLVAAELERIGRDVHALRDTLNDIRGTDLADIRIDIALLKLKSSLWGAVLGGVSGTLVTGAAILLRMIH